MVLWDTVACEYWRNDGLRIYEFLLLPDWIIIDNIDNILECEWYE